MVTQYPVLKWVSQDKSWDCKLSNDREKRHQQKRAPSIPPVGRWQLRGSKYVTLDHKTSHKGQFFEIGIYTSSESWINKLYIDVWFVMLLNYFIGKTVLKMIDNQKNA